jgi:hypothetical protein
MWGGGSGEEAAIGASGSTEWQMRVNTNFFGGRGESHGLISFTGSVFLGLLYQAPVTVISKSLLGSESKSISDGAAICYFSN